MHYKRPQDVQTITTNDLNNWKTSTPRRELREMVTSKESALREEKNTRNDYPATNVHR